MIITVSNKTHITEAPAHRLQRIKDQLTLTNLKFIENERMGRWNGNTPKELSFHEVDAEGGLVLPRGFTGRLLTICKKAGVDFIINDRTRILQSVKFDFQGQLCRFQERAVADILPRGQSTLSVSTHPRGPPGSSGKILLTGLRKPSCIRKCCQVHLPRVDEGK